MTERISSGERRDFLKAIAAVAGTAGRFRARKTGNGTWSLYRIAS